MTERLGDICKNLREELTLQRDWYWSCRGRTYFMELIIALERLYGLFGDITQRPAGTAA